MPRDDYAKARAKQVGQRALATGNYFGGKRESDSWKAREKQKWKNKIAADKKAERERAKAQVKTIDPHTNRSITLMLIVCLQCDRTYTSINPPPRTGSRMRCKCGGRVCLEHQR
jgi:hypothetical protein